MKTLQTERLILRPWKEEDKVPFAIMNSDPEVMEHFPALLTKEQSDQLYSRLSSFIQQNGWGLWAVEVPGVADFIGFIGLFRPTFTSHFTPCVEVGWRLARPFWGKGYATEGALKALDFGFNELKLDEIVSFTAYSNTRSQAVMQKIGMKHKLEDDFDHPLLAEGHPLRRHVLYRCKRADE